jgi:hypothetical protein
VPLLAAVESVMRKFPPKVLCVVFLYINDSPGVGVLSNWGGGVGQCLM